ncbi:MAG TPA: ferritin-like domain-containing protein [Gemmatimonadales bacterium]|nr:ferritin-like domain-containing protein [Gemmatimonadales bacterium]
MMGPFHEMFLDELRDMYDAEQQLIEALPKMAKAASDPDLQQAFNSHLEQTRGHFQRLESAFESLGEKGKGNKCEAMKGLVKEGGEIIDKKGDMADAAVDAGLIAAAQKVEHYEIASYGTLATWSRMMGHDEVTALLEATLAEEKAADETLNALAQNGINEHAMAATES